MYIFAVNTDSATGDLMETKLIDPEGILQWEEVSRVSGRDFTEIVFRTEATQVALDLVEKSVVENPCIGVGSMPMLFKVMTAS